MPGSRVNDPLFEVPDVAEHQLDMSLRLPSRLSLPIQAIYSYFHADSWKRFQEASFVERQRLTVVRAVSTLELALLNYVEAEEWVRKNSLAKTSEEELTALRTAQVELKESLDVEKAKVQSVLDSVDAAKRESYDEGRVAGVNAFLSSPSFYQKQKEAVEAFKSSAEYKSALDRHVELFKSSPDFENLLAQKLEEYKDSAEFEDLQLELMKSAGDQIFERFRSKRPDVDLSFLDESDEEGGDGAGPSHEAAPAEEERASEEPRVEDAGELPREDEAP